MRLSTKHMQFVLVAVGVVALVAIDLYAGNKDRNVPLAEQLQEQQEQLQENENASSNLERRAAEGGDGGGDMPNELDVYNNNMLDASLAAHGEELPAAAYHPHLLGQDDQPKPRAIARRNEDFEAIMENQEQQIQPGAMDRYEVRPDTPKPAYMPPPRPVRPLQQVPPPAVPQHPPQPQPPRQSQPKPAQQKPKPRPRPIKPNFLDQANEAASAEPTKIDYNPSANAGGGLRGVVDAGRNQVQDAANHPHLAHNQERISEMEVVEGEVQRRKTRATLLTGGLFGGIFVVYKAASMGYLLF